MFEHSHWSEYLIPMPMAISLMSTLLLVSSQFERDVELIEPKRGYEYLKWDMLQPNLVDLSSHVKNSFLLSNNNMNSIKVNSKAMHKNMNDAVQFAFSNDRYEYQTLLTQALRYISEDAKENKELAKDVSDSFTQTGHFIEELLSSLKNSESIYTKDKELCIQMLDQFEKSRNDTQEALQKAEKEKEEFDKQIKQTQNELIAAVNNANKVQCVDGIYDCNTCAFEPTVNLWTETGECQVDITQDCVKYEEFCSETEEYCKFMDN